MTSLEPGLGSREIFYCARPSCSALFYSKTELERHTLTAHTETGKVEEIEDEFSFDSDNEEEDKMCEQTEDSTLSLKTEVVRKEVPVKQEGGKTQTQTDSDSSKESILDEKKLKPKIRKPYKKKESKDEPPAMQIFTCKTCNESYKTQIRLDTHNFKAHSIGGEVCNICFKTCPNTVSLKAHHALNHSGSEEKAPCHMCGKVFINKHRLNAHLNSGIHTDATIKCSRCPKLFPNKINLISHERVHDEAKFLCSDCPVSFRWKKRLEKHQHLDHGKPITFKTYTCDECGRVFFYSSDLSNHKKFHKKDPSSTCNVCDKTFHKPETMRRHVDYVHNKVKNHNCDQCEYKASQKEKLQKHVKKVHLKLMETCNICKLEVKHVYHHVKIHNKDFENPWQVHKTLKTETDLTNLNSMETCNICKIQVRQIYYHVMVHSKDFDNPWEVHKALKTENELTQLPLVH